MKPDAKMPTYNALPLSDKWRVARFLSQGKAPNNPRMARAAVELAENYRSRGRVQAAFGRWWPVVAVVVFGAISIPAAIGGDLAMTIASVLLALGIVAHLMSNPALRPKNVAQSLEASRRVLTSGG
jgi:hypothetical protein